MRAAGRSEGRAHGWRNGAVRVRRGDTSGRHDAAGARVRQGMARPAGGGALGGGDFAEETGFRAREFGHHLGVRALIGVVGRQIIEIGEQGGQQRHHHPHHRQRGHEPDREGRSGRGVAHDWGGSGLMRGK